MNARLLGGLALAGALALPSAAAADTTLVGGPVKVKGYDMTIIGNDAAKDSLTVMFARTAGKSLQQHMYSFDSGVTVTATKLAAKLGPYGKINLSLVNAKTAKSSVPKGCTGNPGTTRKGTLTGSVKFVADKTYFKTVKAKSLKGQSLSGGKLDCAGSGGNGGGGVPGKGITSLSAMPPVGDGMLTFTAQKGYQSVMRMDDDSATAPASIMHFITAETPDSAFDVAPDLSSAKVTGASPFLSGVGTFEGEAFGSTAAGTLTGNLTAKFDSIGSLPLAGDDTTATLSK